METAILQTLDRDGAIADTGDWASSSGYDHNAVVGSVRSLHSHEMITSEVPAPLLKAITTNTPAWAPHPC